MISRGAFQPQTVCDSVWHDVPCCSSSPRTPGTTMDRNTDIPAGQGSIFTSEGPTSGQRQTEMGWIQQEGGSGMQVPLLSPPVLLWKEVISAEWQRVYHSCVFSVLLHYVWQRCWIYISLFCISHFLDPWRSFAHSNNININREQSHSCLLKAESLSMLS